MCLYKERKRVPFFFLKKSLFVSLNCLNLTTLYSAIFKNILMRQEFLHMTIYLCFVESSFLNHFIGEKTAENSARVSYLLLALSCPLADAGTGIFLLSKMTKSLVYITLDLQISFVKLVVQGFKS